LQIPLRVVQPASFFKKKLNCWLYNPQVFFKKISIAGCTTRNAFGKIFSLRVVQPAMFLKKILCCGLYNPQGVFEIFLNIFKFG